MRRASAADGGVGPGVGRERTGAEAHAEREAHAREGDVGGDVHGGERGCGRVRRRRRGVSPLKGENGEICRSRGDLPIETADSTEGDGFERAPTR